MATSRARERRHQDSTQKPHARPLEAPRLPVTPALARHASARARMDARSQDNSRYAEKECARRRGRRAQDPAARGEIAVPDRGRWEGSAVSACTSVTAWRAGRLVGRTAEAAHVVAGATSTRSRPVHAAPLERALAQQPVGSSQNGSEKASRRSPRLRPISASMRWSRPARGMASRRFGGRARRLQATASRGRQGQKARTKVPPATAERGCMSVMAVSIQFVGNSARPLFGRRIAAGATRNPHPFPLDWYILHCGIDK